MMRVPRLGWGEQGRGEGSRRRPRSDQGGELQTEWEESDASALEKCGEREIDMIVGPRAAPGSRA